jgi:hypothetical protein
MYDRLLPDDEGCADEPARLLLRGLGNRRRGSTLLQSARQAIRGGVAAAARRQSGPEVGQRGCLVLRVARERRDWRQQYLLQGRAAARQHPRETFLGLHRAAPPAPGFGAQPRVTGAPANSL